MLRHARADYFVRDKDDRLVEYKLDGERRILDAVEPPELLAGKTPTVYKHIFGESNEAELPDEGALRALGEAMKQRSLEEVGRRWEIGVSEPTIGIPAGYTYLGQFIFHDITAMLPNARTIASGHWKNARTPALDLDSVLDGKRPDEDPKVAKDGFLLEVGWTKRGPPSCQRDLPRARQNISSEPGRPYISDDRNDDFLPLAQCHMLMLKFFNAVARMRWETFDDSDSWWKETRRIWVQHFQHLVLEDYLRKIVDDATYQDVLAGSDRLRGNRRIVAAERGALNDAWFPLEFAGAVGRFGHSMIRERYEPWGDGIEAADMSSFMEFSYLNSTDRLEQHDFALRSRWEMDWDRMFKTPNSPPGFPICSQPIDTRLSNKLFTLPDCITAPVCERWEPNLNLATKTLIRGHQLRLTSAQQALRHVNDRLANKLESIPSECIFPSDLILRPEHREALIAATPLWYYVLREAEMMCGGCRLGPLGSRLVMETIHATIAVSSDSILAVDGWQPSLMRTDRFLMADLLSFVKHFEILA